MVSHRLVLEQVLAVLSKLVQVLEPLWVVMLPARRLELLPAVTPLERRRELERPLEATSPSMPVPLEQQLMLLMSVLAVSITSPSYMPEQLLNTSLQPTSR